MDELDKSLTECITGELHDEAMAAFNAQLDAWGLVMPPFEALVCDCGLGEFYQTGLIECWIANEREAGYCGKFLYVFDGQTCPLHHHRVKIETFFIVKGTVRMTLDGADRDLQPGDVLRVPVGGDHAFTGVGPALILEVSMPCQVTDNVFADDRITKGRP